MNVANDANPSFFLLLRNNQQWTFLVTAALLDDLINGLKLLLLSSTRGSKKCFVAGMSLVGITVLAVYSSFFYNQAIAMSDTGELSFVRAAGEPGSLVDFIHSVSQ